MLATLRQEIEAVADETNPLPQLPFSLLRQFADTGRRLDYERAYFAHRARLVCLAATAMLDGERAVGPLEDMLWSVCDEYTWALPAHVAEDPARCVDLFACETAHTLAETIAMLGSRVDGRVAERVRAEVERRVFGPLEDPRPLAWEGYGNNWESVCAGAAGMAALALLPDGARLTRILDRCRGAMDRFLAGYGSDGGCPEGVGYWVYGFGYFVYFSEALRERTGVDLMADAKVREIANFAQRVALSDGSYVPFSDTDPRPMLPPGLMTRLSERFGTDVPARWPSLHEDHCYRWAHVSRTLQWWRPTPPSEVECADTFLPDLAWVVSRGPFSFAAKGGHNDEPHNHNDLGHFVLHTGGESILDDLGAGEYTRAYFGEDRYQALHPSAEGHSVPVIDGRPQLAGLSTVLHHRLHSAGLEFDLELSRAYDVPGLRSLVRRFRWHRRGLLELTDEVIGDRELPLDELFISRHRPVLDGDTVSWAGRVCLAYNGFQPSVEEIGTADHHGRPETVFRLRLRGVAPAGHSRHRFAIWARSRSLSPQQEK